jgi:hypothetical protein
MLQLQVLDNLYIGYRYQSFARIHFTLQPISINTLPQFYDITLLKTKLIRVPRYECMKSLQQYPEN